MPREIIEVQSDKGHISTQTGLGCIVFLVIPLIILIAFLL
jgi:hypothetical protein